MNPLYRAILSEVEAPLLLEVAEPQREAFRTRPLLLEPGARGQTSTQTLSVVRIGLGLLALAAIPGVSSAASSYEPFLSAWVQKRASAAVEGAEAAPQPVSLHLVSPSFFRTFGIELLAGRELNESDGGQVAFNETDGALPVMIVSQRFAERSGLTADGIIGRTVNAPFPHEVIGVVADVRSGGVTSEIELPVFTPVFGSSVFVYFYVRSARQPEELMSAIRQTLTGVDPTMSITNLRTMEQQFRQSIAIPRFFTGTSTVFAVLATALAALGLYGVLAYSVAQRSREIGLRFAIGAPAGRIRGLVLRQVARMAVVGIVLGAIAAWLLGRAAQSLLFGAEDGDPLTLAAAAAVLATVTLAAAYIPARRASRVDPMTVLRYE